MLVQHWMPIASRPLSATNCLRYSSSLAIFSRISSATAEQSMGFFMSATTLLTAASVFIRRRPEDLRQVQRHDGGPELLEGLFAVAAGPEGVGPSPDLAVAGRPRMPLDDPADGHETLDRAGESFHHWGSRWALPAPSRQAASASKPRRCSAARRSCRAARLVGVRA